MMKYDRYRKFRQQTHQMLGKAKDSTFELMDSVMTTRNASCLAEFSLSPLFRRKWSSTYEAIEDSCPNRNKLMKRYVEEIASSGYVHMIGVNPCQRCVVITRDSQTGAAYPNFQKTFINKRQETLPEWTERSRFNHFYRLAINTRVPKTEVGKTISLGNELKINLLK